MAWTASPGGSRSRLDSVATPFYVRRGSTLGSLGFLGALASMLGGLLLLVRRLGPWLRSSSTSELVTVALFANLMFVFAAASHLLGLGVATLLGPFSSPDPSGEASRLDAFGRGLELMAEDQFEESAEIFVTLAPGTYTYTCTFPGHYLTEKGTLTITAQPGSAP